MSLIRTGVVLAVVIAAMPSDKGEQQRLYLKAVATLDWLGTYCDRNPGQCTKAAEYWVVFKNKAQFAGELALDATKRYVLADTEPQRRAQKTSFPARRSTLTPDDLEPAWRASSGGI